MVSVFSQFTGGAGASASRPGGNVEPLGSEPLGPDEIPLIPST